MVVKLIIMNINKRYSKMKVRCFKTPNASYTHRCMPLGTIYKYPLQIYRKIVNNI